MTNYLRNSIILMLVNAVLISVGVLVLPNLALGLLWALGSLAFHFVALAFVAVWELYAEFGSRERHPTARKVVI